MRDLVSLCEQKPVISGWKEKIIAQHHVEKKEKVSFKSSNYPFLQDLN